VFSTGTIKINILKPDVSATFIPALKERAKMMSIQTNL